IADGGPLSGVVGRRARPASAGPRSGSRRRRGAPALHRRARGRPDERGGAGALRELAAWFGVDGRTPAQLATWRRLLALAQGGDDAPLEREARRMVRALVILVDGADPAASPVAPDMTRRSLAKIAARGG